MTLSFWMAAEKWFNLWAPVSLGIIMFSGLIAAFALTKRKTNLGKKVLGVSAVTVLGFGLLLFINNQRYESYLEPAGHVTPVIRHTHYKAFKGYEPMSRSSIDTYARYHDPEGVMATGLYEEEIVEQPVTYLGKKYRHHYFECDGEIFKQYESSVVFDDSQAETVLVGTLYHLKNPDFKTIGFVDTQFIFYDRIVIAEEDLGKTYEPEDEFLVPTMKDVFLDWTFRYY